MVSVIACIRRVITIHEWYCVKAQFGRSNPIVLREVSEMTLQPYYFAQLIMDGRLHLHRWALSIVEDTQDLHVSRTPEQSS